MPTSDRTVDENPQVTTISLNNNLELTAVQKQLFAGAVNHEAQSARKDFMISCKSPYKQ